LIRYQRRVDKPSTAAILKNWLPDDTMNASLVLTTVNAPYSQKLHAHPLAHCLLHADAALEAPGHMSSFFGDVKPDLQIAFAHLVNVSKEQLVASAKAFANYSGESYPLAA
jgi:hypothetical protein